jgi:acetyl esterase
VKEISLPSTTEERQASFDIALSLLAQWVMSGSVHAFSYGMRSLHELRGGLAGLDILREIRFARDHPAQVLDVWRTRDGDESARPGLVYYHGGGFQRLSKQTHWHIAERFARAGFVVFNCNYGLAPRHAHPVAARDALGAYGFVVQQASNYGVDPTRLVVAGESAGANLALGVAIACSERLSEPAAQRVHELGKLPRAALLYSGLLQASELARFFSGKRSMRAVRARVHSISFEYARRSPHVAPLDPPDPLLDPLLYLEKNPDRAKDLPAIFASVGTRDPIRADTLRLERVLRARAKTHRVDIYRGEPHAFESLPVRRASAQVFADTLTFLRALDVVA